MDVRKIAKLRKELQKLRSGKYNLKPSKLVSFAGKVGRFRDTTRGKEPTYTSIIPGVRPLSIPGHPTINPHTADAILDVLEADIDRWEESLKTEEKEPDEDSKGLPRTTVRKDRDSNGT
jgi:hypothetical protein